MRILRGRRATIEADREISRRLLSIAADGECAVRVWTPHRQIAFGRRDRQLEGYDRARELARDGGFPSVERDVGGRAVAYDGETTLAFARAEPVTDFRRGTDERYERATAAVERALTTLESGLEPVRGEPDDSFCPGAHSLSVTAADGGLRKIVGIAQRVRQDAAVVAGTVLVANRDPLAAVLEDVYGALAVPFDPESVGTVADANADGTVSPPDVRSALEDALVGHRANVTVESVGESRTE
ncbi:lipoate--protein ligase family protein [Natronolimnohabitans sp. A-GB9]|uniref:lipoyl protein ligase domain-containing protein n=1 Tax=Natronolimnohabitans sp. A-GB9 TaxID=3069757 RepID=UPI0027AEDAB6|nr:lipoate--protein ligase family protein [Natronolimnohabitans sp. A-GB9]MDQ2052355.1 lipoate--protein ligase family protein [Natronolimnohabitans sp. A-GB9]